MKNAVLLIDYQQDFCNILEGSLYVQGAREDCDRASNWLKKNESNIDHIYASLDTHLQGSIFFSSYWQDKNGKHPSPFTVITSEDVSSKKWTPEKVENSVWAQHYVDELAKANKVLVIWPLHCISETPGHKLYSVINTFIENYALLRKAEGDEHPVTIISKGMDRRTEMFGIFFPEVATTELVEHSNPIDKLHQMNEYDRLIVMGEARSHCVLSTLQQIAAESPSLLKKTVVLLDTMSVIPGFEQSTKDGFESLERRGMTITDTAIFSLSETISGYSRL